MQDPELVQLADQAFAAAVHDELWGDIVERLMPRMGAMGAVIGSVDQDRPEQATLRLIGFRGDLDRAMAEYGEEMGRHDPQPPIVFRHDLPSIYADHQVLAAGDPAVAAYTEWQEARIGSRYFLTCMFSPTSESRVGISFHRSAEAGPAGAAQLGLLARVQQVLRPAVRLARAHADLLESAFWDGLNVRDGRLLVLLGESGRARRISPAAEALLARASAPLRIRGGMPEASDPECDAMLQTAIKRANASLPQGETLALRGPNGALSFVSVQPLGREGRALMSEQATVLLALTDAEGAPGEGALAQVFGLTLRERTVAALLATGLPTSEIADRLLISHETVRVHLRNLFAKTGTSRQSELVRLLNLVATA